MPRLSHAILFLSVILPPALASEAAIAQTDARARQEHDCTDDALRLCQTEIPDETRIENCLVRQRPNLSPACRAWFTSRK